MKDSYFVIMFVLQILTLIIINWQYYAGNEIEAIFNFERAIFILGMIIFAEVVHRRR